MAYTLFGQLAILTRWQEALLWFRFYPFHAGRFWQLLLALAAGVICWGAAGLWKLRRRGFYIYMCGKSLLGVTVLYCIYYDYSRVGEAVPWQTLVAYLGIWLVFPLIFSLHLKRLKA